MLTLFDKSFTVVNVNEVLNEFYTNAHINVKHLGTVFGLTKVQKEVLKLLKQKNISRITIELDNELKSYIQVNVITKKMGSQVKEMVLDLARIKGYKDIKITANGNGAVCIEETDKNQIDR
ncbi:MAG: hypothetical protein H6551_06055 [Chitinophagales bacterium]|nr:hypothetical protein [Chitinophagales bacterium]